MSQFATIKRWLSRRHVLAFLGGLIPASLGGWWALSRLRQSDVPGTSDAPRPQSFDATELMLIERILRVVLPSALSDADIGAWAMRFDRWVTNYDPNAETDHSFIRPTRGDAEFSVAPSPLGAYRDQLESLGPSLERSEDERREAIHASIREVAAASVEQTTVRWDRQEKAGIPSIPRGENLILDLLSFYYRSRDAHDRLFGREIRRYACRGLHTVGRRPPETT